MQLNRLKNILKKARMPVSEVFSAAFKGGKAEDYYDLEEQLILSDISMETTDKIIKALKAKVKEGVIIGTDSVKDQLKDIIKTVIRDTRLPDTEKRPVVIMVSGVNGAGKTTSIAKLAHFYKEQNMRILLSASDTYRAAADTQLDIWSKRTGCDIYISDSAKDPAAVSYNAYEKAVSEDYDMLIIDTAGRMHTNKNLMSEINKIYSVLTKSFENINLFSMLVIDGTTGKNAVLQAKQFLDAVHVDSLFITKLDGTAKGGTIISIADELGLPISFAGVGEDKADLWIFEPDKYINSIIE